MKWVTRGDRSRSREHGIEVTAVHNHMLNEHPRLVFLRFWAVDKAEALANSLPAALGAVHLAPG